MTLRCVDAKMQCDGCNEVFMVRLDPAEEMKDGTSLMSVVEEEIRADFGTSIQHGMHLCQKCTRIADNLGPEDYEPSRDEILKALGAIDG